MDKGCAKELAKLVCKAASFGLWQMVKLILEGWLVSIRLALLHWSDELQVLGHRDRGRKYLAGPSSCKLAQLTIPCSIANLLLCARSPLLWEYFKKIIWNSGCSMRKQEAAQPNSKTGSDRSNLPYPSLIQEG
jgi:hypothetical protein